MQLEFVGIIDSTDLLYISCQVNWLCTASTDSVNLIVCDASKVVKVYNFLYMENCVLLFCLKFTNRLTQYVASLQCHVGGPEYLLTD